MWSNAFPAIKQEDLNEDDESIASSVDTEAAVAPGVYKNRVSMSRASRVEPAVKVEQTDKAPVVRSGRVKKEDLGDDFSTNGGTAESHVIVHLVPELGKYGTLIRSFDFSLQDLTTLAHLPQLIKDNVDAEDLSARLEWSFLFANKIPFSHRLEEHPYWLQMYIQGSKGDGSDDDIFQFEVIAQPGTIPLDWIRAMPELAQSITSV